MVPSPGPVPSTNPPQARSPRPGAGASRVEASAALVLRYFEMWNSGHGAAADDLLSPTFVEHAHPDFLGPAAVRAIVPRVHALYPDAKIVAEIVAADVEYVAVRTHFEPRDVDGHPDGPRRGMALFRIADGKLAEQWSWYAPADRLSRPAGS
jgi:predicted SnoaL-like aldol condensation-catalyzing enzyme